MTKSPSVRPATTADAMHLARLIDIAGHGLPGHFLETAKAAGKDVRAFGAARARRDTGSFSCKNATNAESGGRVAGRLVAYEITAPAGAADDADMPAMFVPIHRLENRAVGSACVSVLAVYPDFRGRGIGAAPAGRAYSGTVTVRPSIRQTCIPPR